MTWRLMLEHHTLKRVFLNKPCSIYATLRWPCRYFKTKTPPTQFQINWLSTHGFLQDFKLKNNPINKYTKKNLWQDPARTLQIAAQTGSHMPKNLGQWYVQYISRNEQAMACNMLQERGIYKASSKLSATIQQCLVWLQGQWVRST